MRTPLLLSVLSICISLTACDSAPGTNSDVKADVAQKPPAPKNWAYRDSKDEMTGQSIHVACTDSITGTVTLCIRKWGPKLDSYLRIEDGQFFCYEEHCSVKVKVDKGPAITLEGDEDASGDTRTIYLPGGPILKKVRAAQGGDLMIQPPLYSEGMRVFHFDTDDLVWK